MRYNRPRWYTNREGGVTCTPAGRPQKRRGPFLSAVKAGDRNAPPLVYLFAAGSGIVVSAVHLSGDSIGLRRFLPPGRSDYTSIRLILMPYHHLLIETHDRVGLIRLNRPQALNALCSELMIELSRALVAFEADDQIGAIIITGDEKAFAAGADIAEMKDKSYMDVYKQDFITDNWEQVKRCRKPVIAAVSGYALGGGCELAMMCDFIVAAESAQFGQPEIKLGIIPGAGGTQRLTRLVGKSKAMDLCLTGRMMDAEEAERCGLVARIVPTPDLLAEALKIAHTVAEKSLPALLACKESVNRAYETGLADGLLFERRQFHALFAVQDQKEGMAAFIEKRKPHWQHR